MWAGIGKRVHAITIVAIFSKAGQILRTRLKTREILSRFGLYKD